MFKTQEYNAVLWKLCQAFSCIAKIQVGRPLHWYQARGCLYVHVRYNKCTMTYSKNMAALEVVCAEVVGAVPQKVVVFKGPSVSCIEDSEVCCILRKYAAALKMAASSVCKQEIYWEVKRSQTEPSCLLSPLRIVRFPPSASVLLHLLQFPKTARCFLLVN